jgi:hypothetical protein
MEERCSPGSGRGRRGRVVGMKDGAGLGGAGWGVDGPAVGNVLAVAGAGGVGTGLAAGRDDDDDGEDDDDDDDDDGEDDGGNDSDGDGDDDGGNDRGAAARIGRDLPYGLSNGGRGGRRRREGLRDVVGEGDGRRGADSERAPCDRAGADRASSIQEGSGVHRKLGGP